MTYFLHTQGDPIQANMEPQDIHHFRPLLIPGNAFRISGFQCIRTQNWQQTLENNTSLFFNTVTKFDPIPSEGFPNHYFRFVSYNQLPTKLYDPKDRRTKGYPVLTGTKTQILSILIIILAIMRLTLKLLQYTYYIGCYITSGEAGDVGDPNKNLSRIRKVEIQNLK